MIVPVDGANPRSGSSALIRNSMACRRGVTGPADPSADCDRVAGRDQQLGPDQVHVGALLGRRVLDLQAGIDLQERQRTLRREQELDRPGVDVAGFAADGRRRALELGPLGLAEERRGRLLDQLLVAPLQGAVAGSDDHYRAADVGQDLGFDVPPVLDVGLDETFAAPERGPGLADRGVEQRRDLAEAHGRSAGHGRRRRAPP